MKPSDYLTVSALTTYIKRKFDVDPYLGKVYLTGEISNFRLRKKTLINILVSKMTTPRLVQLCLNQPSPKLNLRLKRG